MNSKAKLWAIVPAAGVGKRVGGNLPKQYMPLQGQALIWWTLKRLLALSELSQVTVVISADDEYWQDLAISDERVRTAVGGVERCDSVLNGLDAIADMAKAEDWVLVHDAARPCVRIDDIRRLIDAAQTADQGAILAVPAKDTIKLSNENNEIDKTVDRNSLWHALTPQMFKYAELRHALEAARADGFQVTDEASAMEYAGNKPLLVEGASDNIKVTLPEDLTLAEYFINHQENPSC